MSASTVHARRKVSILLVGESPHLFSRFQSPLEKVGCQCHFVRSHQELGKLLGQYKLDIVLNLNTNESLSEIMTLLMGQDVSMFHMVPVEEGCWWVPVLRNGESCLGTRAFRRSEFTYILAEIIKSINTDTASGEPSPA